MTFIPLTTEYFFPLYISTQDKGIKRIAVGIGPKIDLDDLEDIAGSPERVVLVDQFLKLKEYLKGIKESTCGELRVLRSKFSFSIIFNADVCTLYWAVFNRVS